MIGKSPDPALDSEFVLDHAQQKDEREDDA